MAAARCFKMSSKKTVEFIDAIRRHPYLYDMDDPRHKDNPRKMQTWLEIATQFNMYGGDEAKMKWRNLKDCYIKHKKSMETSTGLTYKKYKNWPWAEFMQFLDDLDRHRQPDDSLFTQHLDVYSEDSEIEFSETSRPETSFSGPGKRKHDDQVFNMMEYFEKGKQETQSVDHIDQLFLTYANTYKQLPQRIQINLKLKMAELFAAAEMEGLNQTIAQEIDASRRPTQEVNAETPPVEDVKCRVVFG